jgi:hypothetical protein
MEIWGSGGVSMFDTYSLHHIVWFIAITVLLTAIFRQHAWMGVLAILIMWEVFESWVCINVPGFPYAGKEQFINKVIGDTISDAIGFGIAMLSIRSIRKWKYAESSASLEKE